MNILRKNIIIIVIILLIVIMSQQSYSKSYGKSLYLQVKEQISAYWTKLTDWFKSKAYPNISGEVEQKTDIVQQEITKQKDNLAQNVWGNIKNYFANIFTRISGTQVQ